MWNGKEDIYSNNAIQSSIASFDWMLLMPLYLGSETHSSREFIEMFCDIKNALFGFIFDFSFYITFESLSFSIFLSLWIRCTANCDVPYPYCSSHVVDHFPFLFVPIVVGIIWILCSDDMKYQFGRIEKNRFVTIHDSNFEIIYFFALQPASYHSFLALFSFHEYLLIIISLHSGTVVRWIQNNAGVWSLGCKTCFVIKLHFNSLRKQCIYFCTETDWHQFRSSLKITYIFIAHFICMEEHIPQKRNIEFIDMERLFGTIYFRLFDSNAICRLCWMAHILKAKVDA